MLTHANTRPALAVPARGDCYLSGRGSTTPIRLRRSFDAVRHTKMDVPMESSPMMTTITHKTVSPSLSDCREE